jgi:hypothetical protein
MKRPTFYPNLSGDSPALRTPYWTERLARLRQWLTETFTVTEPEVLFGGNIQDAAGEPIAFASVVLKGTRYETATNAAGHFVLHIPLRLCNGAICLRVSARGFTTLDEVIGSVPQADLQFSMKVAEGARVIPFSGAARKTN